MEETFNNSHGEGEDTISFLDENDVRQPPNKNYEEESFISHELDGNSDFEEAWDDFSSWRGQNSGDELMLVEEVENESDNSSDGQNRKGTEDDDSYKYGSEGYSSAVSENGSSRPHPIKIKSRKEESESDHSDSDDQMVLTPAAQANYHKIAQKMRPLPLPEKPCAPMQELLSARNSMFGSIFSLADGSGSETGSVHMAGGRRSPALGPWEEGHASCAPSSARWSDGAAPPSYPSTGRDGAGMIGAVAAEAVEEAAAAAGGPAPAPAAAASRPPAPRRSTAWASGSTFGVRTGGFQRIRESSYSILDRRRRRQQQRQQQQPPLRSVSASLELPRPAAAAVAAAGAGAGDGVLGLLPSGPWRSVSLAAGVRGCVGGEDASDGGGSAASSSPSPLEAGLARMVLDDQGIEAGL